MNTMGAEVPPPGAMVNTVTLTALGVPVPAVTTSAAGTVALSWVAPTKVVASALEPNWTIEQGTKELPVTVSVNVGEPAGMEVGVPTGGTEVCEIEVMIGSGRLVKGVVIVKGMVFDVPDGVETETPAVPENAMSDAKIDAVS